jgi:hypothetical protein
MARWGAFCGSNVDRLAFKLVLAAGAYMRRTFSSDGEEILRPDNLAYSLSPSAPENAMAADTMAQLVTLKARIFGGDA